jgi:hypothetical protein
LLEPQEVRQAQALTLGMMTEEVRAVMGVEPARYDNSDGSGRVIYGKSAGQLLKVKWRIVSFLKVGHWTAEWDSFPVHIHHDTNDRVDRIKRESEIVER